MLSKTGMALADGYGHSGVPSISSRGFPSECLARKPAGNGGRPLSRSRAARQSSAGSARKKTKTWLGFFHNMVPVGLAGACPPPCPRVIQQPSGAPTHSAATAVLVRSRQWQLLIPFPISKEETKTQRDFFTIMVPVERRGAASLIL